MPIDFGLRECILVVTIGGLLASQEVASTRYLGVHKRSHPAIQSRREKGFVVLLVLQAS